MQDAGITPQRLLCQLLLLLGRNLCRHLSGFPWLDGCNPLRGQGGSATSDDDADDSMPCLDFESLHE